APRATDAPRRTHAATPSNPASRARRAGSPCDRTPPGPDRPRRTRCRCASAACCWCRQWRSWGTNASSYGWCGRPRYWGPLDGGDEDGGSESHAARPPRCVSAGALVPLQWPGGRAWRAPSGPVAAPLDTPTSRLRFPASELLRLLSTELVIGWSGEDRAVPDVSRGRAAPRGRTGHRHLAGATRPRG